MSILLSIISFIKKHSDAIISLCLLCVGLLIYRNQTVTFADKLRQLNDVHTTEITKINAIHDAEKQQLQKNADELERQLEEIQKQYTEQLQQLSLIEKKQVAKLTSQYKNNPNQLNAELEKLLNAKIIDYRAQNEKTN